MKALYLLLLSIFDIAYGAYIIGIGEASWITGLMIGSGLFALFAFVLINYEKG